MLKKIFVELEFQGKLDEVKFTQEFSSVIHSIINQLSSGFFINIKLFTETSKLILKPVTSVDKLNLI